MARYGCTITVATGKTPSSQTDFAWVAVTANFPSASIDGGSTSFLNGGGNVRCYTDDTKATQLPVEITEFVTGASPSIIIWGLSGSLNVASTVYIEADTTATSQPAASATYGSQSVWPDNESVWHLEDLTDSTGNATSLTTVGTPSTVDGVVGEGKRFASSPDYLYTSTVGVVEDDSFNITFWYKRQVGDVNQNGALIGIADNSSPFGNFGVFSATRSTVNLAIQIYSRDTDSSPIDAFEILNFSEGDSVFISVNQNSSGSAIVGIHNGTTYTGTSTARLLGTTPDRLSFNRVMDSSPEGGSRNVLDEVRLTSPGNTKSSDRITSEYNNQLSPSTFWTTSAWENQDGSVISPSGIPSEEAFGTPSLNLGVVTLLPTSIASEEAVGVPTVINQLTLSPLGIESLEAFGNSVIQMLLQDILPLGTPSQEAFGSILVTGGDVLAIPTAQRQTWNSVANYLRIVGFKGADNDVIVAWLRSEGIVDGTYNDLWNKYLLQNGFSALTLADNYAAWRQNLATALFENGVLTCSGTLSCSEIIPCGE
jgi:hypothetical protein